MVDFIKRNKILVGLTLFVIAVIYVFFPVSGRYSGLIAPDAMPFFTYQYRIVSWHNLLGGADLTPYSLYWMILDPLYAHELTFIIDSFILTLAGVYYLRGRGVSATAAWCGGLALGLSGYTFTLFCAGHRGYFHMFSAAIWSFGLLDRGFRTKKLFYFAMLGMIFAWGVGHQPDVLLLVGALAGAYALWLTIVNGSGFAKTALSVWPRFLVAIVFLGLAGFGGIYDAVTTQVVNRKAQIAGSSRPAESTSGVGDQAQDDKNDREQWLFATNWSLPPEDMLEFVVPGIFGNESMYGSNPYWGRLGQPHKSVFQKGRMMPNYRQHTVYLGVIPVVFAFFAVFVWLRVRKIPDIDSESKDAFRDVPFWIGVWVICLLLSMGRFTPLYRLFYAIPYMDLIRAPVKFLHLVEVASAMLCGYGVHAFLSNQRNSAKLRFSFVWIAAVVAGFLLVTALVFMAGQTSITEHIKALGMVPYADSAVAYAVRNIGRSLVLVAPVAAFAVLLRRTDDSRLLPLFGYVVMALLVFDQAFVARRYVKVIDLVPYYKENIAVKTLRRDAAGSLPRVLNYAPRAQSGHDWFRLSLGFNGIQGLMPGSNDAGKPYAELFSSLQKAPMRLWQALNVRYLILPYTAAEQLIRSGGGRPLLNFELGAGVVRQAVQPGETTLSLVALSGIDSKPRLLTRWQGGVTLEGQITKMVDSTQVVSDAKPPDNPPAASDAALEVLFEQSIPGAYSIGVKTSSSSESLLVFNQRDNGKFEVLVDGTQAEKSVADGVWIAVKIPSGEHEVVLRAKRKPLPFILSLIAMLSIAVWGGLRIMKGEQPRMTC
ncbi:MAG: hypothetical protein WC340_04195 [Kiritimatiellia bacterium]